MNPYYDRRYGGALSATQGFLDAVKEYHKMRLETAQAEITSQYRRSLINQHVRNEELFQRKITLENEKERVRAQIRNLPPDADLTPYQRTWFPSGTIVNINREASPGEIKSIGNVFDEESDLIPITDNTIKAEDIEALPGKVRTRIGYDSKTTQEKQQIDATIESRMTSLKNQSEIKIIGEEEKETGWLGKTKNWLKSSLFESPAGWATRKTLDWGLKKISKKTGPAVEYNPSFMPPEGTPIKGPPVPKDTSLRPIYDKLVSRWHELPSEIQYAIREELAEEGEEALKRIITDESLVPYLK